MSARAWGAYEPKRSLHHSKSSLRCSLFIRRTQPGTSISWPACASRWFCTVTMAVRSSAMVGIRFEVLIRLSMAAFVSSGRKLKRFWALTHSSSCASFGCRP